MILETRLETRLEHHNPKLKKWPTWLLTEEKENFFEAFQSKGCLLISRRWLTLGQQLKKCPILIIFNLTNCNQNAHSKALVINVTRPNVYF